jgi:glycosyltransferase involved in cell wall biosynthesis
MFGDDGLFGGGERYPLELCRSLAARVECRLVTFGSRARRFVDDGLEVVVLRPRLLARGHPAHPLGGGLLEAVAGADVVHVHHMRSAPARVAVVAARARGAGSVCTDHGLGGGGWGGLLPRMFDAFACVSQYSADLLNAPPARTRIVYGGVDCRRYAPAVSGERGGVLFVGRITPHKGIDRLIRALPPDVELTIAGTAGHDRGDPERGYPDLLRRLARSLGRKVSFLDRVHDSLLPALYGRAAVVVLPSVHVTCYGRWVEVPELLGLSVLEAMACGAPVVASRVGGLGEVVVHGETGYLVEPGDVGALGDCIAAILGDPTRARRLGAAGRRRAVAMFSWDECAERCLDLYAELCPR